MVSPERGRVREARRSALAGQTTHVTSIYDGLRYSCTSKGRSEGEEEAGEAKSAGRKNRVPTAAGEPCCALGASGQLQAVPHT